MTASIAPPASQVDALRQRLTLILWTGLLAVLPWLWRPGLISPDTKLDLVTDPWAYLGRSLVAWDDRAGFGQLQNQAYGYLFPMGPFFGIGSSLGLPEWVVQRAWWSVLLVVAFLGAERALRSLGVGSGWFSVIPALAYALSPRMLTVLSDISVEAWPVAVCPWLVVALVPALHPGARPTHRARMAVATGLLMTATGGVNAAASLLVVLVPGLLILTAPSSVPRTRVAGWWLLGVLLGSAWWIAPLVVLGMFAFPFLEFIETASVTTSVTSVPQVLRGTSHWLAFVAGPDGQVGWQAGWFLGQSPVAVVATTALAGLGLAGLLARRPPVDPGHVAAVSHAHVRRFALVSLLLGVLLMSAGYAGRFGGGLAPLAQQLLDGPLAAFRNVHKADPLVRLPLAIGLGWALQTVPGRVTRWIWPRFSGPLQAAAWRRWTTGVVVATLAATLLPVWQGRMLGLGSFAAIPEYWRSAATAVDEGAASRGGSTLLLPASRSGIYVWGRPDDEPLAALASSPVVVRDAVMLGAPGAARILDVVDLLASSGSGQEGLAPALARMGVARVVVRHDLAWQTLAEDPALVERTLARSPGFERLERLGRRQGGVSIWQVDGLGGAVAAYPGERVVRVSGGPEAMVASTVPAGAGTVVANEAVLVGDDGPRAGPEVETHVSTDTLRVRRLNTGRVIRDAYSHTLDARAAEDDRGRDLPPAAGGDPETIRVWEGLATLTASEEASDPFALGYRGPQYGAFAAVDGDPSTSWVTAGAATTGRLRLELPGDVPASTLRITPATGTDVAGIDRVRVSAGDLRVSRPVADGEPVVVALAGATGSTVEVEVRRRSGSPGGLPIGVAELAIDGHPLRTSVLAAHPEDATPSTYVLVRDPRHRLEPSRHGEDGATLERTVVSQDAVPVRADVTLTALRGDALDRALDAPWTVTASSRVGSGPSSRPGAALDGLESTGWEAEVGDLVPRLRLTSEQPRTVSSLALRGGDRRRIVSVELRTSERVVVLGRQGGRFSPFRTNDLAVSFRLRDSEGVFSSPEIVLEPRPASTPVRLGCGEAGQLQVGERTVDLAASTSRAALLEGRPLAASLCDRPTLSLDAGRTAVRIVPGDLVQGHGVVLATDASDTAGSENPPALPDPEVRAWSGNRRSFVVAAREQAQLVAFREGFNPGWRAELDGRALEPVRIDGWRQGFLVPGGAGGLVDAEFYPGRWYTAGLAGGGALVVLLLGWWAVLRRRPPGPVEIPADLRRDAARPWSGRLVVAALGGLFFAVGGLVGVACFVGAGLLLHRRPRAASLGPLLVVASGPVLVAAVALGHRSTGTGVAQVVSLACLSLLGWRLVVPGEGDHPPLDDQPGEGGDEDAAQRGDEEHRPEPA